MLEMQLDEVQLSQPEWLVQVVSTLSQIEDLDHRGRCEDLCSRQEVMYLDSDEPEKVRLAWLIELAHLTLMSLN